MSTFSGNNEHGYRSYQITSPTSLDFVQRGIQLFVTRSKCKSHVEFECECCVRSWCSFIRNCTSCKCARYSYIGLRRIMRHTLIWIRYDCKARMCCCNTKHSFYAYQLRNTSFCVVFRVRKVGLYMWVAYIAASTTNDFTCV